MLKFLPKKENLIPYILILMSAAGIIFGLINILVYQIGSSRIVSPKEVKTADAILVLGGGVYSRGGLSPLYKERIDTAVALYRDGKAGAILISGDNGDQYYNEVTPALMYLTKEVLIPEDDVFLDYAGFDTYDSIYRAKEVFKAGSVIVVTQSFHLPRALFIAGVLGLDAQGVSAGGERGLRLFIREQFAVLKAVLDVTFKSKPQFLGPAIPISGSGRQSWGE